MVRKTTRKLRTRYTTVNYAQAIEYACEKAKVPHWSPHRLRHAAATRVRREHGLDAVQALLGHKRAEVSEIYAELNVSRAVEIMRQSG